MTELHDLSALDLAAALRTGEVGAVEVLEHTLERAHALGPTVGAFVHLDEEGARARALEADEALAAHRRAHGEEHAEELPPLLGVPVPIKDLNQVAGLPFEAGSAAFAGNVGTVDDGVVTALRDAGTADELDCAATDVKNALHHLGSITGTDVDVSVIDRIFERFCVGK